MKGRKNMAKKIGLVGIYFPGAYDALHENVPEGFELVDALSPEAYGNLADCEYLISRLDIDPDIINHTPNVKFWQRWGAGFDHVDLKAWGERGIPIATCPGVNSGIVAELAIMLMVMPIGSVVGTLIYVVGFWILFRAFWALGEAYEFRRYTDGSWLIILAVLAIIFSFFFLVSPAWNGLFIVSMISLAFFAYGIYRITHAFALRSLEKE